MKTASITLAILVGAAASATLALGCTMRTVGASTAGTVPKMAPGATLPRWEHICVGGTASPDEASLWINEAGAEGWEMVAAANGFVCFKRPKVAPATAAPAPPPA